MYLRYDIIVEILEISSNKTYDNLCIDKINNINYRMNTYIFFGLLRYIFLDNLL